MLEIWMIRHGETDWNANGRCQGWTNIPLNATGILQVRRLASHLKNINFHACYASDLSRAHDTAVGIHPIQPSTITVDDRLRERYFGSAEGLFRRDIDSQFPAGIPDAETDEAIQKRTQEFLEYIVDRHVHAGNDVRILCVSHGGTIRFLLRASEGGQDMSSISNTSINKMQYDGLRWNVLAVNQLPHLD